MRENIQLNHGAWGPNSRLPTVDGSRLQAAIVNLVLNSRDAIDGHGHITLATSKRGACAEDIEGNPDASPGQFVLIIVSDDGAGITPNVMPMVFEPFFPTKPAGAGTGLGLSTGLRVRQADGRLCPGEVYSRTRAWERRCACTFPVRARHGCGAKARCRSRRPAGRGGRACPGGGG